MVNRVATATQDFTTNDCYTLDYDAGCDNVTETWYEQRCVPNDYYCTAHEFTGYDGENCTGRDADPPMLPLEDVVKENRVATQLRKNPTRNSQK